MLYLTTTDTTIYCIETYVKKTFETIIGEGKHAGNKLLLFANNLFHFITGEFHNLIAACKFS